MQIYHERLYKVQPNWSWDNCFEYSKQAEFALATLLKMKQAQLSEGYFPEYDIRWRDYTFEVKYQNTTRLNVEFRQQKSGNPSGIVTSTANYWLVVSKGKTMDGAVVGKVRQYDTKTLRSTAMCEIDSGVGDARYLQLDPKKINHTWLGDVVWDDDTKSWDMSRWIRPGRSLKIPATTPRAHFINCTQR